jgi:hypothetical protein
MVRLQTLDLRIGVRVPASQPSNRRSFPITYSWFKQSPKPCSRPTGALDVSVNDVDSGPEGADWESLLDTNHVRSVKSSFKKRP